MIWLFTSFYSDADAERNTELRDCVEKNIRNTLIDRIVLLSEKHIRINSSKIEKIHLVHRPTFNDFFSAINEKIKDGDIAIISNADIIFDKTLELIKDIGSDVCYALSRWDDGVLFDHVDSQDCWIFKGKIKEIKCDFGLGIAGCDNRIAHEIEQAGYKIENPSKTIKVHHIHKSEIRNYVKEGKIIERILPPYKIILPSVLKNLNKKKILHISLNNGQTSQIAIQNFLMRLGEYKEILWHKILQKKGIEYLRKHIIEVAKEFKPDLIFMQLQSAEPIDVETIKILKGISIIE